MTTCGIQQKDTSGHIIIAVHPTPAAPILAGAGGICIGTDSIGAIVGAWADRISWYWNGTLSSTQPLSGDSPIVAVGCCQNSNQVDPYGEFVYQDTLYVANINGDEIEKFPINSVGALTAPVAAGNGMGSDSLDAMENERGIFIDRYGYIYVCDLNNSRVLRFPPGSTEGTDAVVVAGGNGVGTALNQVSTPYGIFVDTTGNIYVADIEQHRIMEFPPGSTSATNGIIVAGGNGPGTALNQFNYALGVWVDLSGNIYAADGNGRILLFPPGSTSATFGTIVAGGNGNGPATNQIGYPTGIYVDPAGYMYVSDRGYDKVVLFPPGSTSATYGTEIAGYAPVAGTAMGSTTAPVVFDPTGTYMFVTDYWNYRIIRYTLRQYLTPTAGGSYTATYTSSAGCVSAVSDTVTILPSPTVTWTQGDTTYCEDVASPPSTWALTGVSPAGGAFAGMDVAGDTLYPTALGTYPVTYTYINQAGCANSASLDFTFSVCLGISTISNTSTISLYPNPNKGSFTLSSSDAIGMGYTISDMIGNIVEEKTITSSSMQIDMADAVEGVYALTVKGAQPIRFVVVR
jgi:sugar lactone lactonase YvrE